jgi:hypothetical protein
MIAKNVNTHAHGDVHLVVLAHLRRRWSLSGRDGFVKNDSALFGKWKRYFLSDQTRWSSRPDARVMSSQFIPRVEAWRTLARPVGVTSGTKRSSALSKVDRAL